MNNEKNEHTEETKHIVNDNNTENIENIKSNTSLSNIINDLKNEINDVKKNINDIKVREQAKIENINKNSSNEINKIKEFQLEIFCKNLIPIIEKFKKIKKNTYEPNSQNNTLIQGVFLILESLLNTTKKFGLTCINSKIGEKFNSTYHQIQSDNNSKSESNSLYVESIIKQGYLLNQKVILKTIVNTSNKSNNKTKITN